MSVPIFDGNVTIHAFGRAFGVNFSFKELEQSDNVYVSHAPIFAALESIPASCDFYAPSPTLMNAEIVSPDAMKKAKLARQWTWSRSLPECNEFISLYRGLPADGLSGIDQTTGYVLSSADCALIVVQSKGKIIAAHAGRDSIIDMNRIKFGTGRSFESVVDSICRFEFERSELADMQVWVGFSLSAGPHFQHVQGNPRYPHNTILVQHIIKKYGRECFKDDGQNYTLGWLDTKELIRRQFISCGVPEKNIVLDEICTHNDTKNGEHLWYSNIRSGSYRNLVAVVVQP